MGTRYLVQTESDYKQYVRSLVTSFKPSDTSMERDWVALVNPDEGNEDNFVKYYNLDGTTVIFYRTSGGVILETSEKKVSLLERIKNVLARFW